MMTIIWLLVFLCSIPKGDAAIEYPNFEAALKGYDISKADPFSTATESVDPGWCKHIFEGKVDDNTMHPFIRGTHTLKCLGSVDKSEMSNVKQYKEAQLRSAYEGFNMQIGQEVDVEVQAAVTVEAVEGTYTAKTKIPPFMTRSTATTETSSKINEFFTEESGSMMKIEASCIVDTIELQTNVAPKFTENFAIGVKNMATQKSEASFKSFISNFGTHYSDRTRMGAKLIYQLRLTKDEKRQNSESNIKNCAEKIGLKIFGVQVEEDTKKCDQTDKYEKSLQSTSVGRERHFSLGSKPASTLAEWHKQKIETPAPLKMRLVPLPNLFTEQNLQLISKQTGITIDPKDFLAWFMPMWEKLCTVMGIPCSLNDKGCGFNDNCSWNQKCVSVPTTTDEKGYRCDSVAPCLNITALQATVSYAGLHFGNEMGHGGKGTVKCNAGYDMVYGNSDEKQMQLASPAEFTCNGGSWEPFKPSGCVMDENYKPYFKNTVCDTSVGSENSMVYLKEHDVDCGTGLNPFIGQFKVHWCGGDKDINYYYRCIGGGAGSDCTKHKTTCDLKGPGDGQIIYLDRQKPDCTDQGHRQGYFMSKFHLLECGSQHVQYEYTCCKRSNTDGTCTTKQTLMHKALELIYLDQHEIDCGGQYLRSFKLITHTEKTDGFHEISYVYTCCDAVANPQAMELKQTSCNYTGWFSENSLIWLDRHSLTCGDNANKWISRFKMVECGWLENFYYAYTCFGEGTPNSECTEKSTQCDYRGSGDFGEVDYLDRHKVDCGEGSFINGFKLVTCPNNNVQYQYTCCKKTLTGTCTTKKTPEDVNPVLLYLDRHDIDCEGKYMKDFQLINTPDFEKMYYQYTCCD